MDCLVTWAPPSQFADPRFLGVEVLEDVPVRGPDLGMAPFGDPKVELLVAEPVRLTQEQAQVGRPERDRGRGCLTLGRSPVYIAGPH